ncbi:hypothetical protein MMC09_001524 [Bachmanniomyces sp. S44760]|nr:hypothetical protein [Bachmanniomyces sp. S44760]
MRPISSVICQSKLKFHHNIRVTFCQAIQGMSTTARISASHLERTANEQRDNGIHRVFLPGQWLDVYIRGLKQAGGFTITSIPKDAEPSYFPSPRPGYLELAVQNSPRNPPAAWLWRPTGEIMGQDVLVRVGGSFVWPPPGLDVNQINRVVFVAGGVGINPLISILAHIRRSVASEVPQSIKFLYTTRLDVDPTLPSSEPNLHEILFHDRLKGIFESSPSPSRTLDLYLTGPKAEKVPSSEQNPSEEAQTINIKVGQRITHDDLLDAIGEKDKRAEKVVVYVCGPPAMTDEFVQVLRAAEGMDESNVFCEKWW